jgi:DNA polymerase
MLHHLNIDIETYSSVPIAKAGLYKYVQPPDFQILLFGYSLDGAPPTVIDMAQGEKIPCNIFYMLDDDNYIKHAYKAAFEWYCLNKFWFCSIEQWRDTMLHGLYCGYTAGLDATGKALGLPQEKQKLATGKALIRTFCVPCKPTARNGGRTRTLPHHEPEKWELFKKYNAQDVVTEQEIERRLSPFPVPDEVQHQWETDLKINARGVSVDLDLINGAISCSDTVTSELTDEAVKLTGLENPNSVAQLKGWLEEETVKEIKSLNKETVSNLLNEVDNKKTRRVLKIRQKLGKTSVKKYTAMDDAVGDDDRVRGLLQFYGANRTGRWAGRIIQPQNPATYVSSRKNA